MPILQRADQAAHEPPRRRRASDRILVVVVITGDIHVVLSLRRQTLAADKHVYIRTKLLPETGWCHEIVGQRHLWQMQEALQGFSTARATALNSGNARSAHYAFPRA